MNDESTSTRTTTTTTTTGLCAKWYECCRRVDEMKLDYFVDPDFPPVASSLDGRQRRRDNKQDMILCRCGFPAAARSVQSDGPNYGRFYLACGQGVPGARKRRPRVIVVRKEESIVETTEETVDHGDESIVTRSKDETHSIVRNPYARKTKQSANNNKQKQQQQQSTPPPPRPRASPSSSSSSASSSPPQRTSCNFFQWDADGSKGANSEGGYQTRFSLLAWQHFGLEKQCCLYKKTVDPCIVRQGAVGNCWFLSALAVVTEREYLVRQILPHSRLNHEGCYQVNLCLDGRWAPIIVDSALPVVLEDVTSANKKKNKISPTKKGGGVPVRDKNDGEGLGCHLVAYPAFCAAPERQLWPALVEKAYAKAHGSYAQLSGGFIAEGLTDLTGAPTETVVFSSCRTDPDVLWARLLSFVEAGFVMGVATSQGGNGLVGGHAYSVLDVLELRDAVVGEQSKMTDFFDSPSSKKKVKLNDGSSSATGGTSDDNKPEGFDPPGGVAAVAGGVDRSITTTVRLVRIRNPWGRREWTGEWSVDSERWTKALRRRLGSASFAKGDGTFFMSYEDMLRRFHHMDIAKTREGWVFGSKDGTFRTRADAAASSQFAYELKPSERTWAFVSLVQPKKRANTKSKYWYCDPSMLILKRSKRSTTATEQQWTCEAGILSGVARSTDCEVFLDPSFEYCCVPFSFLVSSHGTSDYSFRIATYSAAPIVIEPVRNGEGLRSAAVCVLHKQLLRRETKLLYPVTTTGVLCCVHGDGCLFFVAVNGAADHFVSLRLVVDVQDGVLVAFGKNGDTHDVAPRSQRLLLVISRNGKFSASTGLSFRYTSAPVSVQTGGGGLVLSPKQHGCPLRMGSEVTLTLAGDLLTGSIDQGRVCKSGGDTVDTYLWIPQLGSSD